MQTNRENLENAKEASIEALENTNNRAQRTLESALTEITNTLNTVADKLRGKEASDFLRETKSTVERHPGLAIASGLAIGIGLGALLFMKKD